MSKTIYILTDYYGDALCAYESESKAEEDSKKLGCEVEELTLHCCDDGENK